jgi:uncharacterized protein (TIGR00251 family)
MGEHVTASQQPFLRQEAADVVIAVHVQPRARRTEISGCHGDRLKVRVAAPPVDGKANRAVCTLLGHVLGVPRSRVAIRQGTNARAKQICVRNFQLQSAAERLTEHVS